ncbi:AAA family ATPase [Rhodococcus hoagii]|nr:AAA family ATPase [Prescottella equi]NKS72197.1 AAA family ATPase [Prescottella equi]
MTLVILGGLPGSGKSQLARSIGIALGCAVLSVDTIEIGMRRANVGRDQPIGLAAYTVAQAIADEELSLRHSILVDAVNSAPAAREAWQMLARDHETSLLVIEVECNDRDVHRKRVEGRRGKVPQVTWQQVCAQRDEYLPWDIKTLRVDSSDGDMGRMLREVLAAIELARLVD